MPRKRDTTPNAICQYCGKAFHVKPSALKHTKYCSTVCRDLARQKRVSVVCANCGKTTEQLTRQAEKWELHFCSMSCYTEWKSRNGLKEKTRAAMRAKRVRPEHERNPNNYLRVFGVREHRAVAEKKLGRPLRPGEVVHHINGIRHDNRPENLMVFASQQEHVAYHAAHPEEGGGAT